MNRSVLRMLALTLCAVLLCAFAVGCQPATPSTDDTAVTTTTAPRPTYHSVDATGSVFIGNWNVSAKTSAITSITFHEDGSAVIVLNGSKLGGSFVVNSDTEMTLTVSGDDMVTTYTVDGDTITLTTENDVMTLSKA